MKKLIASVLSVSLLLSSVNVFATQSYDEDEVIRILNEKTDSPEFWINYIQNPTDPAMGKWLPELILKLNEEAVKEEEEKQVMKITYSTITEGYDWGPAISKVVLKPSVEIDPKTLTIDSFEAVSVRTYKDIDFATFQLAEEATEHFGTRNITNVYMSDENGNSSPNGTYITLEMEVGPELAEGAPLNYNFLTGRNTYVDTYYAISLNENLKSTNGKILELETTTRDEYTNDVKLLADDFVNNQVINHEGVELMYASYKPETASSEKESNPLIIWLHGAGEGGKDTTIPLLGTKTVNLITDEVQQYFGETGAYVLVPQTPTIWMDYDGTATYNSSVEGSMGHSYYTEALMALIDEFVTSNPEIDTDRIYIGGDSNGGYMTINMITTYDDYFAAAFPVCEPFSDSWLTDEKFEKIVDMPMWITHAINDPTVTIAKGELDMATYTFNLEVDENGEYILVDEFSNALYRRLIDAGSENVYYSLFDNVVDTSGLYFQEDGVTPHEYNGHFSWIYTLNNECIKVIDGVDITIFEWLADQSK